MQLPFPTALNRFQETAIHFKKCFNESFMFFLFYRIYINKDLLKFIQPKEDISNKFET